MQALGHCPTPCKNHTRACGPLYLFTFDLINDAAAHVFSLPFGPYGCRVNMEFSPSTAVAGTVQAKPSPSFFVGPSVFINQLQQARVYEYEALKIMIVSLHCRGSAVSCSPYCHHIAHSRESDASSMHPRIAEQGGSPAVRLFWKLFILKVRLE